MEGGPGDAAMRQAASYAGDSDQVAMASVGATPQRAFRTAMMTGSQPPADRTPGDLPQLSARMINKKYFHKQLHQARPKLMGPSGRVDDGVFDFIHD